MSSWSTLQPLYSLQRNPKEFKFLPPLTSSLFCSRVWQDLQMYCHDVAKFCLQHWYLGETGREDGVNGWSQLFWGIFHSTEHRAQCEKWGSLSEGANHCFGMRWVLVSGWWVVYHLCFLGFIPCPTSPLSPLTPPHFFLSLLLLLFLSLTLFQLLNCFYFNPRILSFSACPPCPEGPGKKWLHGAKPLQPD